MVGGKYLCRVGNNLVTVEVVHRIDGGIRPTGRKEPDMFRVRRVGATKDLPNARSAAALRLIPVRKIEASSTYGKMGQWLRTCQECGHKILTDPPSNPPNDGYLNRTCHHCHSPALDFGSEFQKTATPPTERDLDGLPNYDLHGAMAAGEKTYAESIASGCTPDEASNKATQAYDKVSNDTTGHATLVSQDFYLSAAENKIGWCVNCQAFRGTDLEPDSRECECPNCHHHTLYGAELALSGGLINPQEDK
jgi:DNA-directed RNA polymerase subunit RPC12/RpoP